jgi:hypothetical protein
MESVMLYLKDQPAHRNRTDLGIHCFSDFKVAIVMPKRHLLVQAQKMPYTPQWPNAKYQSSFLGAAQNSQARTIMVLTEIRCTSLVLI